MKILIAGIDDPQNVQSWSGIPYHLGQALKPRFQVSTFGGGKKHLRLVPFYLWQRIEQKRTHGKFWLRAEPPFLRAFTSLLEQAIRREKPDFVFSILNEPIAYLPKGVPVVMLNDSTFRLVNGYYPETTDQPDRTKRAMEIIQQRALDRTSLFVPTSEWVRQSAIRDYNFPAERAHVLLMGANLATPPAKSEIIEAIDRRLESTEINFFFAGVSWIRKGGDTAVRIVEQLVNRGINARLHIAGCTPPPEALAKPFLVSHGFLAKSDPAQASQLRDLFKTASFFLVPSIAECYGCVFCEANAYGLPVISRDTGGIASIIREGINGHLLSSQTDETAMVNLIADLCQDRERYRQMALLSREEYETRLNWDAYAGAFEKIVANLA